ncbi:host attachment protein [Rhizobium sp. P32RR-XVIII]|uniref:host attachment protein n=1 Tax=Rhizobium sp. P32RR-XVIII TaxID=2726738 RepID=UPI002484B36B|nr:host attachment protein [Rhizobium sp. P32RR-XVIII]
MRPPAVCEAPSRPPTFTSGRNRSSSRTIARKIEAEVESGGMKRLLLIAPPHALGILRQYLGVRAQGAIFGEIAKDFTKMPVHEIEAKLQEEDD